MVTPLFHLKFSVITLAIPHDDYVAIAYTYVFRFFPSRELAFRTENTAIDSVYVYTGNSE